MLNQQDIQDLLITSTHRCLGQAKPLLAERGMAPPTPDLLFDLRGRTAGQFRWPTGGGPQLRFNLDIACAQPDAFVAETVPHEVAHLLVHLIHPGARPHGQEWRRIMRFLGVAQPRRCHDFQLGASPARAQRRWRYRCDCREHELSTTRHHRAQRGQRQYLCRRCGTRLRPA